MSRRYPPAAGLLSDRDIFNAIVVDGALDIEPFEASQLQPASIDLRLGTRFRTFAPHSETHIDPANLVDITTEVVATTARPFVLHPGEFALAATAEVVTLNDTLAARIEGRSSMGRLGLIVHSTAGFIDPGFSGTITLELANLAPLPIQLRPGLSVAQLCVVPLSSPAARPYGSDGLGSKYQGQRGPTPSLKAQETRP